MQLYEKLSSDPTTLPGPQEWVYLETEVNPDFRLVGWSYTQANAKRFYFFLIKAKRYL